MNGGNTTQEVLRIWLEGDEPRFSLQPIFEDPAVWGIVFVDVARLLGEAYGDNGLDPAATVNRIRESFLAELENPTS